MNDKTRDEMVARLTMIMEGEGGDYEDVTRELFKMYFQAEALRDDGHMADISWGFFPDHIVVADYDYRKNNQSLILLVFERKQVIDLVQDSFKEVEELEPDPDGWIFYDSHAAIKVDIEEHRTMPAKADILLDLIFERIGLLKEEVVESYNQPQDAIHDI